MAMPTVTDPTPTHNSPPIQFLTLAEVVAKTGFHKSYLYLSVKEGTFPPFIKIGRSSRFIASEVAAVMRAWAAQKSGVEIRRLIAALVATR